MIKFQDLPVSVGAMRRGGLAVALIALVAACGEDASNTPQAAEPAATPQAMAQTDATTATEIADAGDVEVTEEGYALGDIVLGDPDAPVMMIEYASLTCPHCATFHRSTLPSIKENYIDTGKVKLVIRELHGHRIGLYAAALARCAGPDKYYAFMDVLFARQEAFLTQDDAANMAELRRVGKLGGLSNEEVEACFNNEDYLRTLLSTSQANLDADQVPATPYLIIQPGPEQQTVRGSVGPAELGAMLDTALGQ